MTPSETRRLALFERLIETLEKKAAGAQQIPGLSGARPQP